MIALFLIGFGCGYGVAAHLRQYIIVSEHENY